MIFLRETTQNDHNRLLYKFENDQKNFGCVGSCGYAPASVKTYPKMSEGGLSPFECYFLLIHLPGFENSLNNDK